SPFLPLSHHVTIPTAPDTISHHTSMIKLLERLLFGPSLRELACTFRPFEQTLRDEIDWYRVQTAS
ncbi:MAG TPA: hypothetical protein VK667_09450, partial [Ktedonobacteraceae bacterium]|nr:hypothetical protein [Ktedonobacteraceae bacterium]